MGKDAPTVPGAVLAGVDKDILGLLVGDDERPSKSRLLQVLEGIEALGVFDTTDFFERNILIFVENVAEMGVKIDDPMCFHVVFSFDIKVSSLLSTFREAARGDRL